MLQVLVAHNTKYNNKIFTENLVKKYPFLIESKMYKLHCYRYFGSFSNRVKNHKYNIVYLHEDSISKPDGLKIMSTFHMARPVWFNLNENSKLKTSIMFNVPNLRS